jgi:hypothetical protein
MPNRVLIFQVKIINCKQAGCSRIEYITRDDTATQLVENDKVHFCER